jgi:protein-S-isoprenylcysteine O-methyltransferase Ste14
MIAFSRAYDHDVQLRATLTVVCWIVWVLIWIALAIILRPATHDSSPSRPRKPLRHLGLRLVLGGFVILAIRTHYLQNTSAGSAVGWVGLAVCVAGFGLAIWARLCLGRNWGMPMTIRARPKLIRHGPYRVVRHPIYSGLLLALVGSALASGSGWLVAILAGGAYFVFSLRVEEADMVAGFPDEYPEYMRHTKRLIPFAY